MKARLLAVFAALLLWPTGAQASIIYYAAHLTGASEVPPSGSPGFGDTLVTINDLLLTMEVNVTFAGLVGNTTASHIHCCQPVGTNAGVATTVPTFTGFPLGVMSGTYDHVFDLTLASSYNPAFVTAHGGTVAQARADLLAGMAGNQTYLNIHSSVNPGGEIRGQLAPVPAPVPEPATLSLLGLGLAGTGMRRWRMRKSA